jgi:hypothetical protein
MKIHLGDFVEERTPLITPLGIMVHEHGLVDYGPKRVRKACNKMTVEGVSPAVIAEFRTWALQIPNDLCSWIDTVWAVRMQAWAECVGQRLPNGATISQTKIDDLIRKPPPIIMHADPFPVNGSVLTAGVAYDDRIEVVLAYLDQHNTWLRKCDDLIAWELGNLIGIRHGYRPSDPDKEIGNKVPCNLT